MRGELQQNLNGSLKQNWARKDFAGPIILGNGFWMRQRIKEMTPLFVAIESFR